MESLLREYRQECAYITETYDQRKPVSYTHLQTRLIVIDTLQRIRTAGNDANAYALSLIHIWQWA